MSRNGKINGAKSWELLEVNFPSDISDLYVQVSQVGLRHLKQVFKLEAASQVDQSITAQSSCH